MKPGEYFYWNNANGDMILERVISKEEYIEAKGPIPNRSNYILCETIIGIEGLATGTIGYIEQTTDIRAIPVANPKAFRILFEKKD